MNNYFHYVEGINFSKETSEKLGQYCLDTFHLMKRSASRKTVKYGEYDFNYFVTPDNIPTEMMDEVGKKFIIPVSYEILGQEPMTDGKIHIDRKIPGYPPRETLIMFPVYPFEKENIGPTQFFDLVKGSYSDYENAEFEFKCEIDWTLGLPAILNLQEYHCAQNLRDDFRFAAQFTTDIEFDEMVLLYKSGELFEPA